MTRAQLPIVAALLATCTLQCAREPAARTAPPTVAEAPPARPDGRLPDGVTPLRYRLSLDVDPARPRFGGTVAIDLRVARPTRHVVLHGRDLTVLRATAEQAGRARSARVQTRPAGGKDPEQLVLTLDEDLAPGDATLVLAWDAPFSSTLGGLYRVEDEGRPYAFTQLEATDARRMFPCFDEPGFKTRFELTVRVPHGQVAVANAPEVSRASDGDKVSFRFAPTAPLPTYLVALAAGDLEVASGPASLPPIRVVTTRGKARLGAIATEDARAFSSALGAWFDLPYPYAKLDLAAVPDFRGGAMENAGLVTFREEILLLDPAQTTTHQRRRLAGYMGHELAHMWFGDLVTMRWWDDLWLNEGLASWLEEKITDRVHPGSNRRLEELSSLAEVMDKDGLASARAVRRPIATSAQADEAFDGFTYTKGAAVIGMLEQWLGEDTFQTGVRSYVKAHAFGNATASDLFAALAAVSHRDVAGVAATFLDRAGVPSLDARAECEGGKLVAIELEQRTWAPLGSARGEASGAPWRIPACVRIEGRAAPLCHELASARERVPVDGARCPAWVWPNAGERGYYRAAPGEKELAAVARSMGELEPATRVSLLVSAWAQVRAGKLSPTAVLELLPRYDQLRDRFVLEAEASVLRELRDAIEPEAAPALRRFAGARLAHLAPLALGPRGADAESTELRHDAFRALGDLAQDDAVLKRAEAIAASWLASPETRARAAEPELLPIALELASRRAGTERLEALRRAVREAKLPTDRVAALQGMYGFDDPVVLERALDVSLTDELRAQDLRYLFRTVAARPSARDVLWRWTKRHWTALTHKLKGRGGARLVEATRPTCTEPARRDVEAFFAAHAGDVEGAERHVARALEQLAVCANLRARASKAAASALEAAAPAR